MTEFFLVTKPRRKNETLALVMVKGYSKEFKQHRFLWSTGEKVDGDKFNAAKPGPTLSKLLQLVTKAYTDLQEEGERIDNDSLKFRIELMRAKINWVDSEFFVYNEKRHPKVERYIIPQEINRRHLEDVVLREAMKSKPNFKAVVEGLLSAGTNELFGFWQSILDGKTKPRNGDKLRQSTIGVKRHTMMLVKEFHPNASFVRMDMAFYNSFTSWLAGPTEVKRKGKDGKEQTETIQFDSNTIGKHVRQLKAVLHLAYRNELISNDRFRLWPVTQEKNEVVTLSKEELLRINDLKKINDVELSGTIENVRDIFVLACFLGARISDFKSFKSESLSTKDGVMFFEYVQEKTGAICKIPIHPIAKAILDKRRGEFPRMISEQNFRYALKDICEAAKLNDRVVIKIRNGKPEYKKKWQAISPHSARRTFASNLFYGWFSKPLPASLCMRYTGHRTEKSFQLYIGASDEELNKKAQEYFMPTPEMKVA